MSLSVVIATRNREGMLDRALRSLEAQAAAPAFEIVVVDNGSSDGTREVVEAAAQRGTVPVSYVYESRPNRGLARNAGVRVSRGAFILFCDDDVQAPPDWIRAHDAAHTREALVVTGPIVNVPSYDDRPRPALAHFSRAFFCTCNVSLSRAAFDDAGGFSEDFDLYGWEDTELGMRLRTQGLQHRFSWDAYIWHVKPPSENTLEVETRKTLEKARMAVRFVRKQPTQRARFAAGLHPVNLLRGKYFLPDGLLAVYAGAASTAWVPAPVRALARAQFLDGMYTRELVRALDA